MTIRKATLKDVPLIVSMWKDFMADHEAIVLKENPRIKLYEAKKRSASNSFKKFISKNIASRNTRVFIAERDGETAGYCFCTINKTLPIFTIERMGYISDLYVKKKFRGSGISSEFKKEAFTWFKEKGMEHVYIKVHTDNPHAHNIYKGWGFIDYNLEMRKKL